MSRVAIVKAVREGAAAGSAKKLVTECPYPAGDLRRSAWVRGYASARPLPHEAG